MTPVDENTLTEWLKIPNNPLKRRVLGVLRFGASPGAVNAVRDVLADDLSSRIFALTLKVLVHNGDHHFLGSVRPLLRGNRGNRRARALVNALSSSGNADYFPIILELANEKLNPVFTGAAIHLVLTANASDALPVLVHLFNRQSAANRLELARTIDRHRDSRLVSELVSSLLQTENMPGVALLLLQAGRDVILDIDSGTIARAADLMGQLTRPLRHQLAAARRLARSLGKIGVYNSALDALYKAIEAVAGQEDRKARKNAV